MAQIPHEIIEPFSTLWWQANSTTIITLIILLLYSNTLRNSQLLKFSYIAGFILCSQVIFMQFYQLYIDKWFASSSIPLHFCGLSSILAGILMFKRNQFAYECLYYWGLAGAFHSLLTPEFTLGKSKG